MKSRFLLMIVLAALGLGLSAQPLHWTENLYDPLKTSVIEKETVLKTEGMYSMKYTYTDPGVVLYKSELFAVTPGLEWNFSVDYLDNDPSGVITARVYFMIDATTPVTPNSVGRFTTANTVDGANWQTLTLTGGATFVPANATLAYVAVRMSAAAAPAWTGTATFYADNLKFTQGTGSTTNLIVNPGFEDWAAPVILPGSTLPNWIESLYDPLLTSVLVNEPTLKTEGFNSLKYTFTDPGVVYLYSDTIHVTAGEPYNFSCDFYDNDPSGLVSTRLWFYTGVPGSAYLSRTETTRTTDMASWQTGTLSGTTPAGATIAYVGIRLAAAAAPAWTGTATVYADNFKYTQGAGNTTNLIHNPGFEEWLAPTNAPEFLTYKFEGITPAVVGSIDKSAHTVLLTVPYETDVTALVSTFTLTDATTAKVGATDQVSATTPNNFTSPVTYALTRDAKNQDWVVTVTKPAPTTGKDIITFKFEGLTPAVTGIVDATNKTVSLEVLNSTNVAALVPTITLSANATVSPLSGAVTDFTSPVTFTVTAQDGSTQAWVVTVTKAVAGQTTLFFEDFEKSPLLTPGITLINNDNFPMAVGEERWADSCWVVSTTLRPELAGTHVAMASSFVTMGLSDRVDRWMILPSIALGSNSTLSWQAMSTTTSGNYPDDYTVYIAPVTPGIDPTVAYFEENGNILINVAPENWSAAVGRPGAGLANRSLNLKNKITPDAPTGWHDRSVYIAFALNTDLYTNPTTGIPNSTSGGSALAIDNIKVVDIVNTGLQEYKQNSLGTSVYPNPARNEVNVAFNLQKSGVANVSIIDLTGREVLNFRKSAGSGPNKLKMDISDLEKGIYMVRTLVNNKVNVTKLIIH
jgi:hypothetical protein